METRPAPGRRLAAAALLLAAAWGCASARPPVFAFEDATWERAVRGLGLDPAVVVSPVRATPAMREAARAAAGAGTHQERLARLHAALLDRTAFGFEYEVTTTFTAEEAFSAKRGNCVSLGNLLVAMARSVGVPAQAALVPPRGNAELAPGDLVRSYTHLVVVLREGGRDALFHFYTAPLELGPGRPVRRIDDLELAALALSNRGVAALEAGDLAAARTLLADAIRLGPTLPDLHGNLGIVLWRQGDVPAAVACFRRGLDLDPHRAALLHNLAAVYIERGARDEARMALASANADEASPYLLVVKGDLATAAGDLKGALRAYRKAHAKDPALAAPLLRIARTEEALGRPARARKAREEAGRLGVSDAP